MFGRRTSVDLDPSPMDMDLFMMELICEFQTNKASSVSARRRRSSVSRATRRDEYHIHKQAYSPKIAEGLRKHFGDKLVEIINERFL